MALEVRRTAFLRQVRVRKVEDGAVFLDVAGVVAGTADRPLELYAVHDRYTILYGRVEAAPQGRPFELRSEPLQPERLGALEGAGEASPVQIDLVNGSTVWYRFCQELPADPTAAREA